MCSVSAIANEGISVPGMPVRTIVASSASVAAWRSVERRRSGPVPPVPPLPSHHAHCESNTCLPAATSVGADRRGALVCADTVEWPRLMDVTSDFLYCRLHGSKVLYTSQYSLQELDQWAARIAAWANGQEVSDGDQASPKPARTHSTRDVFVYFDNDAKVFAPGDAQALAQRVDKLLAR